ncbi:pyridoxal phosphate-dependent aminotransferase [Roseimicrobium sp. ORNL1]|uniref:pyridoxal phosphate-dependent aminotransferase n=1 Tax=Roseimicrobium sp. ORNL1 TaxID=2711231 RepID=UPI0013E16E4C|nr:pyridoxal phosphate-dependent aminotransferase [Roseimicrobium sp. ORNL1]QIF03164.1 pyridoxal phosphate-dependent aminotransferase [Roseimicrobium sp. ORNL1]
MDFIAKNVAELSPSLTLSITSQAKALKKQGVDVLSFGAGEPDFNTPAHITEAAIQALHDGQTRYTESAGLLELRESIATKLSVDNNISYEPSQISVNCGAKHSCYNAILAVVNPGDEVIIPAPYWTSYPEMVRLAGGVPVIVETKAENGWKITPDEFEGAMSPLTKMIILNSPGNPTGSVYSRAEMEAIAEIALGEDILILSDEIYEKLVYAGQEHISIASLSKEVHDLTITINGFSKAYAMTGWRLGYTAAPKAIATAIDTIQSHTTSNPTTFAQFGAIAALNGDQQIVADMREEFDMRRQYMLGRLQAIKNIRVVEPLGAFYFLVNIEPIGIKSVNFAEKLLSKQKVAVVPGVAFGAEYTIRFSYATSLDVINAGMDRFEEFCNQH